MTALVLTSLVLAGCGSRDGGATSGADAGASAPAALEAPVTTDVGAATSVEMLDAGSGERAVRTYGASRGGLPPVSVSFDSTGSVVVGGTEQPQDGALPERTAVVEQEVQPDVDGAQRAQLTYSDLAPATENSGLDELLASGEGFRVTLLRAADGGISSSTLEAPGEARGVARQSVEQMAGALAENAVILPKEPIGEGARWRVTRPADDAVAPERAVTYTLEKIEGDVLTVAVDGSATPTTDTLDLPAEDGGAGVSMHVDAYTSTVRGTLTFSLREALPTDGSVTTSTEARYVGDGAAATETTATQTLGFGGA